MNIRHDLTTAALLAALATLSSSAGAAARVWTGGGNDGKWNTPSNWDTGVPQDGDAVTVKGDNVPGGAMVNDIPGLSLATLTFAGTVPFRLSGQGIALTTAVRGLVKTATVAVTNALDIALPPGDFTTWKAKAAEGEFVLEGAFSGATSKLILDGTARSAPSVTAPYVLAGDNTHGGGTKCTVRDALVIASTNACGAAGTLLEVAALTHFTVPGVYRYPITSAGGFTLNFRVSGTYEFYGAHSSPDTTGTLVHECGWITSDTCEAPTGTLIFHDPVSFPKMKLYSRLRMGWTTRFLAPVHLQEMEGGAGKVNIYSIGEFHDTNTMAVVRPSYALRVHTKVPYAFPSAPVVAFDRYMAEGTTTASGEMDLFGNDQRFDRLDRPEPTSDGWQNRGLIKTTGGPATMYLFGTANGYTHACMMDALSIVWAPKGDYTQTFSNRVHTMTGELIVSNGTVAADGATSFAKVRRIVIASGGRLRMNTTLAAALADVTNIMVAAGGTFEVASGTSPFTAGKALLDYATGASFKLPADVVCDFAGVLLDGTPIAGGTYHPGGAIPGLEGGDIVTYSTAATATWSGGASPNDSVAEGGNWTGGAVPVHTEGATTVTFGDGGAQADIDRAVDWKGVAFTRNFTLGGTGTMTVRSEGIAVGNDVTNTIAAPLTVRGSQTWDVGAGGRLNLDGGMDAYSGTDAIHKTGAGALWINAPSKAIGPFTLGSSAANGGQVYVNTSTNAFGTAAAHEVNIIGVKGTQGDQGAAIFATSTVVERPIVFQGENVYFSFQVRDNVTVRFTKRFTHTEALRTSFGNNARIICEGGARLQGWTCFGGQATALWTFRGATPITADYLYMGSGGSAALETPSNTVSGAELQGKATLFASVPDALCGNKPYIIFSHADAKLDVTGDQRIGCLRDMSGGTITSADPATVYVWQHHWKTSAAVPVTNTAVKIAGAVTLHKHGPSLFVQDCAAETTGGIGVSEGTLRMTAKAVFPKATKFFVEGTGRAELEAKNQLGRNVTMHYDSTAGVSLSADQRIAELYIDGVRQKNGIYGSAASGAPNVIAGFEGSGRLIVSRRGFRIDFK